jgi:hypothetical protein
MANPDYHPPGEMYGPTEHHPTPTLKASINLRNAAGGGKCVVCDKRGLLDLGIAGQLTVHHRIPKAWWKAPGQAEMYYRWRRFDGKRYDRDFGLNTVDACNPCHGVLQGLAAPFPDMMGDKLRVVANSYKERLAQTFGGRKLIRSMLLLPECVWLISFEDWLDELHDLLEERAIREEE